jgi:hypothetical protein
MKTLCWRWSGCLMFCIASGAGLCSAESAPHVETIRAAVARSLPLLERGAKVSKAERPDCFTCHNQGLPIMALTTARRKGFAIDEAELRDQLRFTADFLAKNRDRYREGRGQPGQTFMAGYALWALRHGDWPADETTSAVAEYFLKHQSDQDHWSRHTRRPPSEASDFTANFLGLMSLDAYGVPEQQERVKSRREQVRQWLRTAQPADTEDRVFRLRALRAANADEGDVRAAVLALLETQRPDGGWPQLDSTESDAYATGTALTALHEAGGVPTDEERYLRGLRFLLEAQRDDGSWYVGSRSEPFQTYYESGYPHGEDQFISITAAGWATIALTLALPDAPAQGDPATPNSAP